MIFYSIDEKISNNSFDITISNIKGAKHHWVSEKNIQKYVSNLDMALYSNKNIDFNINNFILEIIKNNPRISDVNFYRKGDELVILCISDIPEFNLDFLSKQINIILKYHNVIIKIIEISVKEFELININKLYLPPEWKPDSELKKTFDKGKMFAF